MPKKVVYPDDGMRQVMDVIRERLRELLAERPDINQTELARSTRTDASTVSKYLSGDRPPDSVEFLTLAARKLGTSVGFLIGEQTKRRESTVTAILTECASMERDQLDALLAVAKTLADARPAPIAMPETAGEAPPAASASRPRKPQGPIAPRARTR